MPLKVFTSCLRNAIFNFLSANNYIEQEIQKGFTPGLSGTFEHTAQMADIINKARSKQRSLVITLLDLKNAYGEVHRNLIQTALDYHHTKGGEWGTPIHYLYGYVPPNGVVILKLLI